MCVPFRKDAVSHRETRLCKYKPKKPQAKLELTNEEGTYTLSAMVMHLFAFCYYFVFYEYDDFIHLSYSGCQVYG
jgi:hypothetical protein